MYFFRAGGREKLIPYSVAVVVSLIFFLFNLSASANEIGEDEIRLSPTFHHRKSGFELSLTPFEMEYYLDNLPHASYLVNKFDIHSITVRPTGPHSYYVEDRNGFKGTFFLVRREDGFREYMGNGSMSGTLVGEIRADVIASIYYREKSSETIVNDLEFWVLIDNTLLDLFCRAFRPLLINILLQKIELFIGVSQDFAEMVHTNVRYR